MLLLRSLVVAGTLVFVGPAAAQAGTITVSPAALTYQAGPTGPVGEDLTLGVTGGRVLVNSSLGAFNLGGGCTTVSQTRVDCPLAPLFLANLAGANDSLDASTVVGLSLEAHGGAGEDRIQGTGNADRLFGDEDSDSITAGAGNDFIDAGAGGDYGIADGPGDDTVLGGPGGDSWAAGPGRDSFSGGDGSDMADYSARTAPLTITLDGVADSGEAGEGDTVGADVEEARGGSGPDRIIGNAAGDRLYGGGGNDTIVVGGGAEDYIAGEEGDDTIDSRDGHYDSVDCGPGNDVVYADPTDSTTGCEVAPDPDGDGFLAPADCAPNDPAVHPGAGEVYGNAVDEDCKDGPGYLRVSAPINYQFKTQASRNRMRFTKLVVQELQTGDRVEVRCTGKGCPFKVKAQTVKAGKKTLNLLGLLKKRYLGRRAVLEVRVLRANQIGRAVRITVGRKGKPTARPLCVAVGQTKPASCT